jgi:hypothetical protein
MDLSSADHREECGNDRLSIGPDESAGPDHGDESVNERLSIASRVDATRAVWKAVP